MRVRKAASNNVHPGVAAAVIILVIAIVQYVWWMKLVHKEMIRPGGGQSGGRGGPSTPVALGIKSVSVDTLAGTLEPGDADGPGYSARFDGPSAVALDSGGNVVVADTRNHRIRVVSPTGRTATIAGSTPGYRDGPTGQALFDSPSGVAVGPDGTIYAADTNNHRIRSIRGGVVSTIAGGEQGFNDGPAATARFDHPTALSLNVSNPRSPVLVVADSGNRRLRAISLIGPNPMVSTLYQSAAVPTGVSVTAGAVAAACPGAGEVVAGTRVLKNLSIQSGDGDGQIPNGALTTKHPDAVCGIGQRWFFADAGHGALLELTKDGARVIAGNCNGAGPMLGFRDGNGERSHFGVITGIATDGKRQLYIADCTNNAIRRITLPTPGAQEKPDPDRFSEF
jgi:hypothetical protein